MADKMDMRGQLEEELRRSQTLTRIVRFLESEEQFETIASQILQDVGECLKAAQMSLVQLTTGGEKSQQISFWKPEQEAETKGTEKIEKTEYCTKMLELCINQMPAFSLCCTKAEWNLEELQFLKDVVHVMESILNRKITRSSLIRSYQVLNTILDYSGNGILVLDVENQKILFANKIAEKQFSRLNCEMEIWKQFYKEYLQVRESMEKEDLSKGIREDASGNRLIRDIEKSYVQFYLKERNQWFEITFTELNWVDGKQVRLSTVRDVTEERSYQEKIEFQAYNDFLTGLYNRQKLELDLEQEVQSAKAQQAEGAVLFIDLDNFKQVNDTLGHQYGDILLQKIAAAMKSLPQLETNCYRNGGDEFICIVRPEYRNELEQMAETLIKKFNQPWDLSGIFYQSTMSMGIALYPQEGKGVRELIHCADQAMYEAKRAGKNQYRIVK